MKINRKYIRRYIHYKYYFIYWWIDLKWAIKQYKAYRKDTIKGYSGTLFGSDIKKV